MHDLLKVLGMKALHHRAVIPTPGDKIRGQPVDNRWTTVDNRAAAEGCGPERRFIPGFSTPKPPVDNFLTRDNGGSPQFAQDR